MATAMAIRSWLPIPDKSPFSLANIPFGIISTLYTKTPRPAIAIGDHALDLAVFANNEGFAGLWSIHTHLSVFSQPTLNEFAALGRPMHQQVRKYLQNIFAEDTKYPDLLKENETLRKHALFPLKEVQNHVPMRIGDYTDFYAGRNHAFNVGVLFRGPENALQPNYNHSPVGYHGRASSVVVSGTPIRRPYGQVLLDPLSQNKKPTLSPCRKLDIELELGAFVCRANRLGEPVPISEAETHIFGLVLMNDWSARDIQAWEYVPLGPFTSKNFGTSISPWVVLIDALEQSRSLGIKNEINVLDYLKEAREENVYDINLEVDLTPKGGPATIITSTNARNLLFSFPQMLTHHSITGCPMQVGDLLGSGTISGTEMGSQGSMLEQCANGKTTLKLVNGEERTFLEDYDTVKIRGWTNQADGQIIGFGDCVGRIEPAYTILPPTVEAIADTD